jgi:hypothetical protein
MWFRSFSPWIVVVAIASQACADPAVAPPGMPRVFAVRQLVFNIPFEIRHDDPTWQPVEAQLLFSTDRGAHWRPYTKVPIEQKYFPVKASSDGEFWFAIRTIDRSGQARPQTIAGPDRRILVDTKPPVLKLTAQAGIDGQVTVRWEIEELNLKPDSLHIVYRPSPTSPWLAVTADPQSQNDTDSLYRGEATFWPKPGSTEIPIRADVSDTAGNSTVANTLVRLDRRVDPRPSAPSAANRATGPYSPNDNPPQRSDDSSDVGPALTSDSRGTAAAPINSAAGEKSQTQTGTSDAGPSLPTSPSAERPRMVNSKTFELEYDVDSVGPSGIAQVELWSTRDGGQTWRRFAVDKSKRSPMRVEVKEEGVYGFRVVVTNGAGLGGKPPVSGDSPDLTIGVDLTKPTAKIVSAKQGVDSEAGQIIISWQADDQMLAARPITLSFSENRGGPWLPIAAGLENTGRYAWPVDKRTPAKVYLRLEVRDEAGNVATHETSSPILIDQSHPTVRIRSVHPVTLRVGPLTR